MAYVQLNQLKKGDLFVSCKTRRKHILAKCTMGIYFHIDMTTGDIYKEANGGTAYVIVNPESHIRLIS